MALSVMVALIFTPALCATILKVPGEDGEDRHHGVFGWFNRAFDCANRKYEASVSKIVVKPVRYFILYALVVGLMAFLFLRLPHSFLPDEDQGVLFIQIESPPGSTKEVTGKTLDTVSRYFMEDEKAIVASTFAISGFSFSGRGQNAALVFVKLKDWAERSGIENTVFALADRAKHRFEGISAAKIDVFAPPAVLELGNATGFDFELLDPNGIVGHRKMMEIRDQLVETVGKNPIIKKIRPNGLGDEPQYALDIDWERASALGLSISDISQTLGSGWGSSYVNQFVDRSRVKRVYIQGDDQTRMLPQNLNDWYVRNSQGLMVPFSVFSTGRWTFGSPKLERYNGVPSLEFLGEPILGHSTGEAMAVIEDAIAKLPKGISYDWTGLSYEERLSGSQTAALYATSLLVVFLCLAALYESWSIPAAVMLVVPLGIIGTVVATMARGLQNDVFFQVGLLTTVGLSAKNAILIVEFAKANCEAGMNLIEATVHAARQRLRPILMTSFAFVLGVLPLSIATGAGAGGRIAIGTGVIGGMLSATALAIFFVPMFFVSVRKLSVGKARGGEEAGT
jgi:hydrophobe/amphiphile efflux-1 (HAE1) family protein